ncbi:UNVERIFIED_CONTAM: hypothetical protein K2H54_047879 [Gekko kuhli]
MQPGGPPASCGGGPSNGHTDAMLSHGRREMCTEPGSDTSEEDTDELQEETGFQSEPDLEAPGILSTTGFPSDPIPIATENMLWALSRSSRDIGSVQKQFGRDKVPGLQPMLQLLGQTMVPADIIL